MTDAQDQAEPDEHGHPRDAGDDSETAVEVDGDAAIDVDGDSEAVVDIEPDSVPGDVPAGAEASGSMGPGEADLEELDELDDAAEGPQGPGLAGTVALAPSDLKGALEALILVS